MKPVNDDDDLSKYKSETSAFDFDFESIVQIILFLISLILIICILAIFLLTDLDSIILGLFIIILLINIKKLSNRIHHLEYLVQSHIINRPDE